MPPESSGPAATGPSPKSARWRVPLIFALLSAALVGVWYVKGRLKRGEHLSRLCAEAMFSERFEAALGAFIEYRERALDDVSDDVRDEVFRLEGNKNFPLGSNQDDPTRIRYFIERAVFLSLAAESALAGVRSGDLRGAALSVLAYVRRHVQSGAGAPGFPDIAATPVHVLCRGHGRPIESAWLMASLLRIRGIHAAVVELPPASDGAEPYYIVGVLIQQKLYLFDPYRGVPLCRASDGCVADLGALLTGTDSLGPGFGGPGTPVTVDGLAGARYLLPADAGTLMPDAYLLDKVVRDNGRYETLYRSFRRDLGNLAAAVFGSGAAPPKLEDRFTAFAFHDRRETVALWALPFLVDDLLLNSPDYRKKLLDAHRTLRFYLAARRAHLFRRPDAVEQYDAVLRDYGSEAIVAEEVDFFKAMAQGDRDRRATELSRYLAEHPVGRFRALATLHVAEIEAERGNRDAALELIGRIESPYDLRAGLLRAAIRDEKGVIAWRFPRVDTPDAGTGQAE